ncbi:MAG TPA: NRDE family protein [Gemmatimonadales bacterium]|jgi:uncharacterized protein with NRDE domain|nr:NRDE family protein [Gemmatimonadales bacterium]
MCLILLVYDAHPDYRLILAANRDEFYDRPTTPAGFWPDAPGVLAGRDLQAGGTWLGVDRALRFAAVTNYRQGQREPVARSRGFLVSEYLMGGRTPEDYVARVESDAAQYNGFNLLVGDARDARYFSNREGRARSLLPEVYGLSNHLLDTPWPKVASGKAALSQLVRESRGAGLVAGLFDLLADPTRAADEVLPETEVGREWERLLSAAFITSPHYGTRSSTVLLIGREKRVEFVERSFGVGGGLLGEVRYTFEAEEGGSTSSEPPPARHSSGWD